MKKIKVVSGFTERRINQNSNNAILALNSRGYEVLGVQTNKSLFGYSTTLVYENGKHVEDELRNQQFDVYNARFMPFILVCLGIICAGVYWILKKYLWVNNLQDSLHRMGYFILLVALCLLVIELVQNRFQNLTVADIALLIMLAILGDLIINKLGVQLPFNLNDYIGYGVGLATYCAVRPLLNRLLISTGILKRWYDE